MEQEGYANTYRFTDYSHRGWDRYQNQKTGCFEEFYSSMPIQTMLIILDGYPLDLAARDVYKRQTTIYLSYSKYQNKKQKIKLNLKKGWKLRTLSYSQRNWDMDKALKNGGSVKISGGKGFYLWICAENTKLKRTQYINRCV